MIQGIARSIGLEVTPQHRLCGESGLGGDREAGELVLGKVPKSEEDWVTLDLSENRALPL